MSREAFLKAVTGQPTQQRVFGTGTSIVCKELMDQVGVYFPDGHTNADAMFELALAGHTLLGLDVVMPLFSVCHEAAAMGCRVNWGGPDSMPESGPPIFQSAGDVAIPPDLLQRPGCRVPLAALGRLRRELGDDAAVCGKVFGSWTQAYHYFGVERFLMMTIDDPGQVKTIMERLLPVTLDFARAQVEAGADCLLLADHATRDLCSPDTYREFLLDMHRELARRIDVPLILHICGNTADRIEMIAQTGVACFHWDTKSGPATEVRRLAGDHLALMGGVSNLVLLQNEPADVAACVAAAARAGINVIGPECAIPLATPLANLKAIANRNHQN